MTAWKRHKETPIPRDGEQYLVRSARWFCPAIVHYEKDYEVTGYLYSESVMADMCEDFIEEEGLIDTEWTEIPK